MNKKIIYLGFHKCGTTSFSHFFGEHGMRVIHNTIQVCDSIGLARHPGRNERLHDLINAKTLHSFIENYDVLTDNPFPLLYEHFDKSSIDALFVLGTRPTDEWLSSMQRYFGNRMPALGQAIYATDENPCSKPENFQKTYEKHNADVREYFRGRPDFLEIQLGIDSNEMITEALEDFAGLPNTGTVKFGRHLPK